MSGVDGDGEGEREPGRGLTRQSPARLPRRCAAEESWDRSGCRASLSRSATVLSTRVASMSSTAAVTAATEGQLSTSRGADAAKHTPHSAWHSVLSQNGNSSRWTAASSLAVRRGTR
ncbi:hypothetical protein [Saccharomonospora xinjiangensis]|uniref:Uncharacterized protein n=1 Tax=Saccharomonospora xinjiangensis XJ-54 TaxID=882086 RepID=I0UZW2_9PSEU|nr:hypothetical protein [Saccharomonospora xinjiangensis]EID53415.1 hypothetical protein SacxiDRAFT_1156 [Saccharomonospora xinjiangensis XJ-54]